MKIIIFTLPVFYLFLSGCSSIVNQQEIDELKSCRALNHEKKELLIEIEKIDPDEKKEVHPIHYGVVTIGALASIPLIDTSSFYVMPALTVTYYNNFIGYDKNQERLNYLTKRKKIIEDLSRRKMCKKNY